MSNILGVWPMKIELAISRRRRGSTGAIRILDLVAIVAALIATLWVLFNVSLGSRASAQTVVPGGILVSNTEWTIAGSPYLVNEPVQIPVGVTLTIDPGVTVLSTADSYPAVFRIGGGLIALGTASSPIRFYGPGVGQGYSLFASDDPNSTTRVLRVSHADIQGLGGVGGGGFSALSLTDSVITNNGNQPFYAGLSGNISGPADIQRNLFVNGGGISASSTSGVVNILHNTFKSDYSYCLGVYDSGYGGQVEVHQNNFIPAGCVGAAAVGVGASHPTINASNNYWSTTDDSVIQTMIRDSHDDIAVHYSIPYSPWLTMADPEAPQPLAPVPSPSPTPSPSSTPTPTPTPTPSPSITPSPSLSAEPSPTASPSQAPTGSASPTTSGLPSSGPSASSGGSSSPSPSPTAQVDSRPPTLSQSSKAGRVTLVLRIRSACVCAGKTTYFFRRSGMTGKVLPYGTAVVRDNNTATRVFDAKSGQILSIYGKVSAPKGIGIDNPYSNTVSFKVG